MENVVSKLNREFNSLPRNVLDLDKITKERIAWHWGVVKSPLTIYILNADIKGKYINDFKVGAITKANTVVPSKVHIEKEVDPNNDTFESITKYFQSIEDRLFLKLIYEASDETNTFTNSSLIDPMNAIRSYDYDCDSLIVSDDVGEAMVENSKICVDFIDIQTHREFIDNMGIIGYTFGMTIFKNEHLKPHLHRQYMLDHMAGIIGTHGFKLKEENGKHIIYEDVYMFIHNINALALIEYRKTN